MWEWELRELDTLFESSSKGLILLFTGSIEALVEFDTDKASKRAPTTLTVRGEMDLSAYVVLFWIKTGYLLVGTTCYTTKDKIGSNQEGTWNIKRGKCALEQLISIEEKVKKKGTFTWKNISTCDYFMKIHTKT